MDQDLNFVKPGLDICESLSVEGGGVFDGNPSDSHFFGGPDFSNINKTHQTSLHRRCVVDFLKLYFVLKSVELALKFLPSLDFLSAALGLAT